MSLGLIRYPEACRRVAVAAARPWVDVAFSTASCAPWTEEQSTLAGGGVGLLVGCEDGEAVGLVRIGVPGLPCVGNALAMTIAPTITAPTRMATRTALVVMG